MKRRMEIVTFRMTPEICNSDMNAENVAENVE